MPVSCSAYSHHHRPQNRRRTRAPLARGRVSIDCSPSFRSAPILLLLLILFKIGSSLSSRSWVQQGRVGYRSLPSLDCSNIDLAWAGKGFCSTGAASATASPSLLRWRTSTFAKSYLFPPTFMSDRADRPPHQSTLLKKRKMETSTTLAVSDSSNEPSSPHGGGSEDAYSWSRLQERMKDFLASEAASQCRLALAVAGGGGHFLSTLAATPGASKVLLEGCITYDRESYRQYVQRELPAESFRYASTESAHYASQAALHRALHLAAAADTAYGHYPLVNMTYATGLACASALQSTPAAPGKRSRAYIAVRRADATGLTPASIHQHKQQNTENNSDTLNSSLGDPKPQDGTNQELSAAPGTGPNDSTMPPNHDDRTGPWAEMQVTLAADAHRSRLDEDIMVSHCILSCLQYSLGTAPTLLTQDKVTQPSSHDSNCYVHMERTCLGDELTTTVVSAPLLDHLDQSTVANIVRLAAERVLTGTDPVVLLMPTPVGDPQETLSFRSLAGAVLPPSSIIFPGSFHPAHAGHVELVKAALQVTNCQTVWFELSLTNADKPSLAATEVVHRVEYFLTLPDMPQHWGILLTNAPLFKQKVDLLYPLQASRCYAGGPGSQAQILPLHFVIGTDTLVRLLNVKYYNNSEADMLQALRSMPCHFVVGGRLEQKSTDAKPLFVSGQEDVDRLPADLQLKFTILKDFRVDISSTEIRSQRAAATI